MSEHEAENPNQLLKLEKRTLQDGNIELKIIGPEKDVIPLLELLEMDVDELANALESNSGEPDVPQTEAVLMANPLTKLRRKVKEKVRDITESVLPNEPYCAKYRESSDPLARVIKKTYHSRLGRDSVKIRVAAKVGDANIIWVKHGGCSSHPED